MISCLLPRLLSNLNNFLFSHIAPGVHINSSVTVVNRASGVGIASRHSWGFTAGFNNHVMFVEVRALNQSTIPHGRAIFRTIPPPFPNTQPSPPQLRWTTLPICRRPTGPRASPYPSWPPSSAPARSFASAGRGSCCGTMAKAMEMARMVAATDLPPPLPPPSAAAPSSSAARAWWA